MQADWKIDSRAHACTRTSEPFHEGQFFHTLLFREKDGTYRREDLCEQAWDDRNDNLAPFSFWRSRYEPPPPAPPEALKKNDAESLLRALSETSDPRYQNAIYILALMLERKRTIRPIEQEDPDTLVYEFPKTGETIILKNPHLTFDQIPAVQEEVSALLDESLGGRGVVGP
jgi:hypothetical protein